MATGRAIFQAHVDGLLPESIPIDCQWVITSGVYQQIQVAIGSGDNIISPPANTKLIITIPPTTNAVVLKRKGNAGDTGTTMLTNQPDVAGYAGGTFIINAASSVNNLTTLIFLG